MRSSSPSDHTITHFQTLNIFYVTELLNFVTNNHSIDTGLFSNHSRNDLKDTVEEEFFRKNEYNQTILTTTHHLHDNAANVHA